MTTTAAGLPHISGDAKPVHTALVWLKEQARQQQLGRLSNGLKPPHLGDVPITFSFEDVRAFWARSMPPEESEDVQNTYDTLEAILRILEDGELRPSNADEKICQDLTHSILRCSVPIRLIRRKTEDASNEDLDTYDQLYRASLARCGMTSELGVKVIYHLIKLHCNFAEPPSSGWFNEDAQITLFALTQDAKEKTVLSFADNGNKYALQLFSWHHDPSTSEGKQWIVDHVLRGYLRRLFETGKRTRMGPAERPTMLQNHEEGHGLSDDSPATKPWKYDDLRSTGVLACLLKTDEKFLVDNYTHLLPPLAALAEDSSTILRISGIKFLDQLLERLPPVLVRDRGLAPVFVDIIFPSLSFLPTLTPAEDSAMILGASLQALLDLYASMKKSGAGMSELQKLSDKVLRQGILSAYYHAGEYPPITTVLMKYTAALFPQLQISAVKYLKDILPMLSKILTNPVLNCQTDTVLVSLHALSATIQACHERILVNDIWTDMVIETLMHVYLNACVTDDRQHPAQAEDQEIRREGTFGSIDQGKLSTTAEVKGKTREITKCFLQFASARKIDLIGKVTPLCEKEPDLLGLFQLTDTPETTSQS